MKNKKKRTLYHKRNSFVKKITIIFYLIIAILSIMSHKIDSLSNLLAEITVYTSLAIMLNTMLKNVSISKIMSDMKLLFD
ncbi:MAG: hypothetical protein IJO32_00395 [Bacilli bacterium]|nr:hypothetical protein [Bacilli bacterium]